MVLDDYLTLQLSEKQRIYHYPGKDLYRLINPSEVKICRSTNCHFVTAENGLWIMKDKWNAIQLDADYWIFPKEKPEKESELEKKVKK